MHAINHTDTKHICTHMHPCTHMHEYFLLRFACWTLLQLAARERVRKHHELLRTAQQCWKAVGAAPRTWHGRVQEPRSLLYTRGAMKTTLFDRPGRNMKSDPPGLLGVQVSRNYWEHLPEIRKHDALMDEFCDRWDGIEEVCPPLRGYRACHLFPWSACLCQFFGLLLHCRMPKLLPVGRAGTSAVIICGGPP